MEIIRRIIHVLSFICYILISLYAIVCIPLLFHYHPVVVLSGSMEPTYKVGSVIYYKKVLEEQLKVGDVITFTVNGEYISHRIVNIENNLFETKGDANNAIDPLKIQYKNIEGRVYEKSIPFVGYYIRGINNNLGFVVLVIVIILVSEFLFSNMETFGIKVKKERSNIYGKEEI